MKKRIAYHYRSPLFLLLILLSPLGCSNSTDPGTTVVIPGIGSSYTWVTETSDGDITTPDRTTTTRFTVAAQLKSFQGKANVTLFNGPSAPLYLSYHEDGSLSRYYPGTYFSSDSYLLPPYWGEFTYGSSESTTVVLIDTLDIDRHVRYMFETERKGIEEITLKGTTYTGIRLDYTFTFEIEEDASRTTIGGRTLYVPAIGWSAWTEETTERTYEGESTSVITRRSELEDYVVSKNI